MDMSQYRGLFLSETREHIDTLNKLVVTLEQEPGSRQIIDALFRAAHSIKGMAATMGFDQTAQLSHRLEDLLDSFRSSGEIPSTAIDYLLAGIDLLEGLLDDLQNDRPERAVDDFMQERPIAEATLPAAIIENMPQQPLPAIFDRNAAEIEGRTQTVTTAESAGEQPGQEAADEEQVVFQVSIDLETDTPAAAARGMLVLRELEKSGALISSQPDKAALRGGAPCQQIQAWLRTSLTRQHIEETLRQFSGVAKVHIIDDRRKQNERRGGQEDARTIRVRTDLLDRFVNLAGELITQRHVLNTASSGRDWHGLSRALVQTGRLIDDLHHHVLQARLMPLENITGRLPRIVRDLSRKTGKRITLQLSGTDVGIDRVILEELADPLVHLVRNAVDHGIEKDGVVTVSARREKDLVLIEVADDGMGMDPDRLRRKAVERGLVTPLQATELSDRDALMLICQPGFSTTEEVTETSGRGVGMDIVKAAVGNLGGTLDILSAPGQGTQFQMRLPLSFAIIRILLVSCAGHPLAIPITRVQRTLNLPADEIRRAGQRRVFHLEEEDIRLSSLAGILGLPQTATGETAWVVLTEVHGRRIGLQVDHFLGHRQAFVKSLGFPLNLLNGLSGATLEGDGRVVFIIDPRALLESGQPAMIASGVADVLS